MFLRSYLESDKLFIHFHANGEDIGHLFNFAWTLNQSYNVNTLAVEYPGYGVYTETEGGSTKAEAIIRDARTVIKYATERLGFELENIIVSGRSIGSGPACILAQENSIKGLVLISPFTSIKNITKQKYSSLVEMLVPDIFDNQKNFGAVKCPTMIVHGIKDMMVPFTHSVDLLTSSKQRCHLFLRKDMAHNSFSYKDELIGPIGFFLNHPGHDTKSSQKELGMLSSFIRLTFSRDSLPGDNLYFNNFTRKFSINLGSDASSSPSSPNLLNNSLCLTLQSSENFIWKERKYLSPFKVKPT